MGNNTHTGKCKCKGGPDCVPYDERRACDGVLARAEKIIRTASDYRMDVAKEALAGRYRRRPLTPDSLGEVWDNDDAAQRCMARSKDIGAAWSSCEGEAHSD